MSVFHRSEYEGLISAECHVDIIYMLINCHYLRIENTEGNILIAVYLFIIYLFIYLLPSH